MGAPRIRFLGGYNSIRPGHPAALDRALLDPFIEVESGLGDHWWWSASRDRQGEAIFKWPKDEDEPQSTYLVVRSLIHHVKGPITAGSSVFNECGYLRCISPHHWSVETASQRSRRMQSFVVVSELGSGPPVVARSAGLSGEVPEAPAKPKRKHRKRPTGLFTKSSRECPVCHSTTGVCDRSFHDLDDWERKRQLYGNDEAYNDYPRCNTCLAVMGVMECNGRIHAEKERNKRFEFVWPCHVCGVDAPPHHDAIHAAFLTAFNHPGVDYRPRRDCCPLCGFPPGSHDEAVHAQHADFWGPKLG